MAIHGNGEDATLRTMDDIQLDGKRVIVRVDFNVTVGDDGEVSAEEDYRVQSAIETIHDLQRRRCRVVLLAHRGRPQENPEDVSMAPIHARLQEVLQEDVRLLSRLYGSEVDTVVSSMDPGSVVLLPNVRTDDREKTVNDRFGQELAGCADAYINEAFSNSHRAHTSMVVLPRLLPSAAGRRTVQEVEALLRLRDNSEHPYVAIASGAKITTKVGMLRQLLQHVDTLCVGGQIANVFLAAKYKHLHDRFSADAVLAARSLLESFEDKIIIPTDVVIGSPDGTGTRVVSVNDILAESDEILGDIGPQTAQNILERCSVAKTVMWNGPVGKWEDGAYANGTRMLAEGLAKQSGYRVVGGGDTVNALETYRVADKYDHVSVGGGAMIAFLESKRMPGLEPLYGNYT